jgi:hypothetical protein
MFGQGVGSVCLRLVTHSQWLIVKAQHVLKPNGVILLLRSRYHLFFEIESFPEYQGLF